MIPRDACKSAARGRARGDRGGLDLASGRRRWIFRERANAVCRSAQHDPTGWASHSSGQVGHLEERRSRLRMARLRVGRTEVIKCNLHNLKRGGRVAEEPTLSHWSDPSRSGVALV